MATRHASVPGCGILTLIRRVPQGTYSRVS
ncbi:hypothetical protein F383_36287 [Gossypium arboreum]|uniref:Uncharacterized protein n=1 Tax=Gossypium arboreum TaxID=29729 RepID=A0A0B0N8D6_GOSAR|nr:hypothetical protein F383_36287 [Gossypium arboreum]